MGSFCLVRQWETLRTCCSAFPIATKWCFDQDVKVVPGTTFTKRTCNRCGSLQKRGDVVATSQLALHWKCVFCMPNTWKWPEMNMNVDLNLTTFQYSDGFGCYHFCLNRFGIYYFLLKFFATFSSILGLQIFFTFGSVLGLKIKNGLQPPTCWESFVAGTMLRRPKPTKERVEPTILNIIAIEIRHLTRFALLLQLRILRHMCSNSVATWA